MNNYTDKKYSSKDVLTELNAKGLVEESKLDQISEFITTRAKQRVPIYIMIMLGMGALVASSLFVLLLLVGGVFYEPAVILMFGIAIIVGVVVAHQFTPDMDWSPAISTFMMQISVTLMLMGKTFFIIGFTVCMDLSSVWNVTLAMLLVTAGTYYFYNIALDRFLSTLAVLASVLANMCFFNDSNDQFINELFVVQFIGAAALLSCPRVPSIFTPMAYAFVFSLCATVFLSSSWTYYSDVTISLLLMNAVLSLGLIALFVLVSGGVKSVRIVPFIIFAAFALLMNFFSAPGLLLALGLLVLGYYKDDKIVLGLGCLLFPLCLIDFYYALNITLLQESLLLVGSGILLFLVRIFLKFNYKSLCEK